MPLELGTQRGLLRVPNSPSRRRARGRSTALRARCSDLGSGRGSNRQIDGRRPASSRASSSRDVRQEQRDRIDLLHRIVDVRREPNAASTSVHLHAERAELSDGRLVVGEADRDRSAALVVLEGRADREPGREGSVSQPARRRQALRPDPLRAQRLDDLEASDRHRERQDGGRATPGQSGEEVRDKSIEC